MEKAANSSKGFDTYQKMRSSDPIGYGEYLCELSDSGLSQKEIAEKLKSNRQLVGRYQRIGRWDREVKDLLAENRKHISNTAIYAATMSPIPKEELLERFKSMIPVETNLNTTPKQNMGELKSFPTPPAYSEISARVSSLEQRIETKNSSSDNHVCLAKQANIRWRDVLVQLFQPTSLLLMLCIIGLTSYLIHQGLIFFDAVDSNPVSSWSSALTSEAIPLLSAACLALCTQWSRKIIAAIILLISISGLGLFMHTSIADNMSKQSDGFTRLTEERNISLSVIRSLQESLTVLPASYVTQRQNLVEKIDREQDKLSRFARSIESMRNQKQDIRSVALAYNVWLRLAAMLLNAFLVHLFFSGFRAIAPKKAGGLLKREDG